MRAEPEVLFSPPDEIRFHTIVRSVDYFAREMEVLVTKPVIERDAPTLKFFLTSNGCDVVFFILEQNSGISRGNFCWHSERTRFTIASESTVEIAEDIIYIGGTNSRHDKNIKVMRTGSSEYAREYVLKALMAFFELKEYLTGNTTPGSYISSMGYYEI